MDSALLEKLLNEKVGEVKPITVDEIRSVVEKHFAGEDVISSNMRDEAEFM